MKKRNALYGLMVFIMGLMLIFTGACTKSATVKDVGAEQQTSAQKDSAAGVQGAEGQKSMSQGQKVAPESGAMTGESKAQAKGKAKACKLETYVVKKGDCLWAIAKKKKIYNDPFLWPVIYEANKGKIKKANLIYPGQKLKIPRSGITIDAIKDARKKAGAKKPYLPPAAAIVPKS
ncbi:MAG: LysM peptidoglycan-binding domain-containing protein [Syntrophales bacterium]|jgi:nucleoid-associated protein YgaU